MVRLLVLREDISDSENTKQDRAEELGIMTLRELTKEWSTTADEEKKIRGVEAWRTILRLHDKSIKSRGTHLSSNL